MLHIFQFWIPSSTASLFISFIKAPFDLNLPAPCLQIEFGSSSTATYEQSRIVMTPQRANAAHRLEKITKESL